MLPEKLRKLPSVQTFKKQISNIELTSLLADGYRDNCVLCINKYYNNILLETSSSTKLL